jgi:hypothetical protein
MQLTLRAGADNFPCAPQAVAEAIRSTQMRRALQVAEARVRSRSRALGPAVILSLRRLSATKRTPRCERLSHRIDSIHGVFSDE